MRNYLITTALVASLAVPLGPPARATAAGRWLPELLKILPELKEMFDTGSKIATNDVPALFSADTDLPERARRAARFHPGHVFEKEPVVDGNRMFSADAAVRAQMRQEYADFVERESRDIVLFKQRRDEQAKRLEKYERAYDRLANFANKAPDLIDRASRVPVANEVLPNQLAEALLEAEQAKSFVNDIVTEYRRIVQEYDAKLKEAEVGQAAHVSMLGIIDALQPPPKSPSNTPGAGRQKQDGAGPRSAPRPGYADGIKSAVGDVTIAAESRAQSSSSSIAQTQARIGPPRQMPSSMPTVSVPMSNQPTWTGTITPYAPGRR